MNSSIYKLTFNRRKHFVLNSSFLLRLTTVLIESAILGIAFSTYFCFCFKVGKKNENYLLEKSLSQHNVFEKVSQVVALSYPHSLPFLSPFPFFLPSFCVCFLYFEYKTHRTFSFRCERVLRSYNFWREHTMSTTPAGDRWLAGK